MTFSTGLSHDEKPTRHAAPPPGASLTIAEFCASEKISRSLFYKLVRQGEGPRMMHVGSHKRISAAALHDWRREREAAAS